MKEATLLETLMQNDSNIEFIGFNDILITRFADAKNRWSWNS